MTSIDNIFEKANGSGRPNSKPFRDLLTKIKFDDQLAALAKTVETGQCAPSVLFGRFKGGKDKTESMLPFIIHCITDMLIKSVKEYHYLVRARCEKTPNIKTAANWKAIDPCRWLYSVTSPTAAAVEVLFLPTDTIQLRAAIVGSCYLAKSGTEKAFLTLGLIVDQYVNQSPLEQWILGVSHGFTKGGTGASVGKQAFICPNTVVNPPDSNTLTCKRCYDGLCKDSCCLAGNQHLQTTKVADGANEVKISTLQIVPANHLFQIFKSDFAAFVMREPINYFKVEPIKSIVADTANNTLVDTSLLQSARTRFAGLNGVSEKIYSLKTLMALLEAANLLGNEVFVFKKGMASNWTWGVLDCVDDDEYEFSVTDPWKDGVTGQKQFCMAGDCGSIVFVIDENSKAAPIGYLHSTATDANGNMHLGSSYERVINQELVSTTRISKESWKFQLTKSFKFN